MSAFIASGGSEPLIISNDGWFPDIDTDHMRASLRLDGAVTNDRLKVAAINGVLTANRELAVFKAGHQAEGAAALTDVTAEQIDGESRLVHLYRRAVYCNAGAELSERYRSYDSTASGNQRADDLTPSIDEYRRDARWAISDILGIGRSTVELI